jgi:hypothetical protein
MLQGTWTQRIAVILHVCAFFMTGPALAQDVADTVRKIEHERLQAMINSDVEAAARLHANDFELINAHGRVWPKKLLLERIASGVLEYKVLNAGEMQVRVYGDVAAIRYEFELEVVFNKQEFPLRNYWTTIIYERRDGHWLAVWSQSTEVFVQN